MNYRPTCAVCGHPVEPDVDHVHLEKETKRRDARDEREEFYLHEQCAVNTIGNWEQP